MSLARHEERDESRLGVAKRLPKLGVRKGLEEVRQEDPVRDDCDALLGPGVQPLQQPRGTIGAPSAVAIARFVLLDLKHLVNLGGHLAEVDVRKVALQLRAGPAAIARVSHTRSRASEVAKNGGRALAFGKARVAVCSARVMGDTATSSRDPTCSCRRDASAAHWVSPSGVSAASQYFKDVDARPSSSLK